MGGEGLSPAAIDALSGGIAGGLSVAVTYPLTTVSTIMQVGGVRGPTSTSMGTLRSILREEGWQRLFTGLDVTVLATSLAQAIYFLAYGRARPVCVRMLPEGSTRDVAASTIAGVCSAVSTNPLWVLNTRCMTKRKSEGQSSFLTEAGKLLKNEGVKGLFRGLGPALMLVSNPVIVMVVVERIKAALIKAGVKLTSIHYFFLGAIGKLVATLATYPLLVAKSRKYVGGKTPTASAPVTAPASPTRSFHPLASPCQSPTSSPSRTSPYGEQLESAGSGPPAVFPPKAAADGAKLKAMSTPALLIQIVKEDGFSALYSGVQSKLYQTVLTAALLFMFKEQVDRILVRVLGAK